MSNFIMSFIGGAIGSGIMVYFASTYFYKLGKKHGAETERNKFIAECHDEIKFPLILPEKRSGENESV